MVLGSQDSCQSEVYGLDGPLTGATSTQEKAGFGRLFRKSLNPFQGHTWTSCQAALITPPLPWDLSAPAKVSLNLDFPFQDMRDFLREWTGMWVQQIDDFLQIPSSWPSLRRNELLLAMLSL